MTSNDHATCADFYRKRGVKHLQQMIAMRRDSYELNGRQGVEWMRNEAMFQYLLAVDDFRQAARDEAPFATRKDAERVVANLLPGADR